MNKSFFILLLSFFTFIKSNPILAQDLTFFNIDTTNYPTVKADFYAINEGGKQIITLSKEEVFVKENTLPQQVIKVTNPSATTPKQISLVLTVDVSGSMNGANIQLAKSAAMSIVNKFPLDVSECAITSFDDGSFINTDFTRDKSRLIQSVNTLKPNGGTDYNAGLIRNYSGGLEILKNSLHEKVLIFLTDGYGDVDQTQIIQKAKAMGATVYVITLGMRTPDELKNIANATKGKYFENVVSDQEINAIYLSILYRCQGFTPSTVEWVSAATCGYIKNVTFGETVYGLKPANAYYNAPSKNVTRLVLSSNNVTFNGLPKDTTITLKALNGDFSIQSFNSSNSGFTLISPSLPYTIKNGVTEKITIRSSVTGASTATGRIELVSPNCQSTYVYLEYLPVVEKPTINLFTPDGKETFFVGEDTLIRWSLQKSTLPVNVSFSSNSGKDWTTLAKNVSSNNFNWEIPNTPGVKNLIKVEAVAKGGVNVGPSKIVYDGYSKGWSAYTFSPDGARYISQNSTEILLNDTYKKKIINKIPNTIQDGYWMFSPDGKFIFIYDKNKPTKVYDAFTFEFIEQIGVFGNTKSRYIEPYINNDFTQYVANDANGDRYIFDFKTGAKIKNLSFIKGTEVGDFTRNYIVTIEEWDHKVVVWDYINDKKVLELKVSQHQVVDASFNQDETIIVVQTWGENSTPQDITAFNLSGKELYKFNNTSKSFQSLSIYKNFLLCAVKETPTLVNINTGEILATYSFPEDVKSGWFNPFSNGKYLVFSNYMTDKVYLAESGISSKEEAIATDQSSTVFSIVAPKIAVSALNFPAVYIGNYKDSIAKDCIKNKNPVEVFIKQISFEGKDASAFNLVKLVDPITITANSNKDLEIRFVPTRSGLHEATLKIISLYDTIRVAITGVGSVKPYSLNADELNMGLVEVGKVKDSVFTKVITNTTATSIYVTSMNLSGPDKTQFKIISPVVFELPAGASKEISIRFSPTQRGKTSTQLSITTKNTLTNIVVPIYAEGYLPRTYTVKLTFTDAITKTSITASAVCRDILSNGPIACNSSDNGQSYSSNIYGDRKYVFSITKDGYKPAFDTINTNKVVQETITKVIQLTPIQNTANTNATIVSGVVLNKSTQAPISLANISFYNAETKTLIQKIESSATGNYSISLPVGSYTILVEKADFINDNGSLEILNLNQSLTKNFDLTPIVVGQTISLPNVYFERSKAILLETSNESLDRLFTLLKENPTIKIELLGHTDNQGDPQLNVKLSEERVAAIKTYLVDKGIDGKRITGKGYGGAQPIASNATEETRKLNRRVEFKIVSK